MSSSNASRLILFLDAVPSPCSVCPSPSSLSSLSPETEAGGVESNCNATGALLRFTGEEGAAGGETNEADKETCRRTQTPQKEWRQGSLLMGFLRMPRQRWHVSASLSFSCSLRSAHSESSLPPAEADIEVAAAWRCLVSGPKAKRNEKRSEDRRKDPKCANKCPGSVCVRAVDGRRGRDGGRRTTRAEFLCCPVL